MSTSTPTIRAFTPEGVPDKIFEYICFLLYIFIAVQDNRKKDVMSFRIALIADVMSFRIVQLAHFNAESFALLVGRSGHIR
jgi:hypothetical protein